MNIKRLWVRTVTLAVFVAMTPAQAKHPLAAPGVTSLTNDSVSYQVPETHHVVLRSGDITATIVDNSAIDLPDLPGHRSGYNGVASLRSQHRDENLFVPAVAGLNFEHIHDGTAKGLKEKFEPRVFSMQLRVIDDRTVEIYQPPTGNWDLESCGRYHLLEDGTIEYTFECIPHGNQYRNGYIGLFWASYIDQPEEGAIHFRGRQRGTNDPPKWIKAITPRHGVDSTHPPASFQHEIQVDSDFPLTLVGHRSPYVHTDSWYYGVSHGMALVMMFRPGDQIWLAQSPSGGGNGNPAWDFQWFIPDFQIGEAYGFRMRAAYLPFTDRLQIERATKIHRQALGDRG